MPQINNVPVEDPNLGTNADDEDEYLSSILGDKDPSVAGEPLPDVLTAEIANNPVKLRQFLKIKLGVEYNKLFKTPYDVTTYIKKKTGDVVNAKVENIVHKQSLISDNEELDQYKAMLQEKDSQIYQSKVEKVDGLLQNYIKVAGIEDSKKSILINELKRKLQSEGKDYADLTYDEIYDFGEQKKAEMPFLTKSNLSNVFEMNAMNQKPSGSLLSQILRSKK